MPLWSKTSFGVNHHYSRVMAIKKGDAVNVAPGANAQIEEKDILVVVSSNEAVSKLPE